ncbi:MAG: tetratricopeptide (TPR) repeat protein [Candidatus Paceibacteria bacterium]|jgi:tetratricopeptide (TPR) repeat protein
MEEALAKAAALDPREGGVYMVSGDAYALQGRWTEALAAFERALRIDPVKWGKDAQIKLQQVKARM